MDEIDPPVRLDSALAEPSKHYILNVANTIDFDYPQVFFLIFLKFLNLLKVLNKNI